MEFSETADAARRLVKKLYLYTNNHFSAKSVANAAMIKKQLGSRSKANTRKSSSPDTQSSRVLSNVRSPIFADRRFHSLTYILLITSPF